MKTGARCRCAGSLVAALALLPSASPAQPTTRATARAQLAGEESVLWLVSAAPGRSVVFRRGLSEAFRAQPALNGELVSLTAADGTLYGFLSDGAFYALVDDAWLRRRDLPRRALPLDLAADSTGTYALIESPAARELPLLSGTQRPTTTIPYDAGGAPLTVVRYEAAGWAAIAACPPTLRPEETVRIGLLPNTILLLRAAAGADRVEMLRYDSAAGHWEPGPTTPPLPGLQGFWFVHLSRVPTLLAAVDGDGADLVALRLLGQEEATLEWRSMPLELSAAPPGGEPVRYAAAAGFNQHLALLNAGSAPLIRFARADGPPAEQTVAVSAILAQERAQQRIGWLQIVTILLLFLVLLALFLFRRGAMVLTLPLPPEFALALALQRVIGWLLDLAPFVLITAAAMGVDWQAGLRELFGWALGSDAAAGKLPAQATLIWWFSASGLHTIYALLMELLTGRTVGKVLMGTRILAERGTPATTLQILARNGLRLVELLPPLWLLGFLVVLSRNRQRLGDIFARTLVVRHVRPPADGQT